MEIVIVPSPEDGGRIAADIVCGAIEKGARTLGLATGSSPLHTYRELTKRHRESGVSFAAMSAYLLDEYVGLTPDQPQSYAHTIRTELVDHLDIDNARVFSPTGEPRIPVKLHGVTTLPSSTTVPSTCRFSASVSTGTSASTSRPPHSHRVPE
ncbi:hypothetical protein N806_25175 [Rhodococcus sp. P27]|nr:hypothetical protein N806_25175 [Rhodococcus sp. P27]